MSAESQLVETSIELRAFLTGSSYGLDELLRIYIKTPVSDYFVKSKPRKRKLPKRNYLV